MTIKALVKYGLASPFASGAFFWPNTKHLQLDERSDCFTSSWVESGPGRSCSDACEDLGGCDLDAMLYEGVSATSLLPKASGGVVPQLCALYSPRSSRLTLSTTPSCAGLRVNVVLPAAHGELRWKQPCREQQRLLLPRRPVCSPSDAAPYPARHAVLLRKQRRPRAVQPPRHRGRLLHLATEASNRRVPLP